MINPSRVAFEFLGRPIYWYGVLMAIGIACAVYFAMREARRKGVEDDTMLDLCLIAIPSGIVGARLYYVLFELERYLQNPLRILYIWEGGLAIYGAVLGGALGVYIYCRIKKMRFLRIADLIVPGLALAQSVGRWGNFFNQEAFGLPITNEALLWFPFAVKIDVMHYFDYGNGLGPVLCVNPYHLATFFYESMWCLFIFAFLWFFMRKRAKHDGDLLIWYALLYSAERMLLEALRSDSLWLINGVVRVSQFLSFIIFAAALAFLIVRHFREKKLGVLIWPDMGGEAVAKPDGESGTQTLEGDDIGIDEIPESGERGDFLANIEAMIKPRSESDEPDESADKEPPVKKPGLMGKLKGKAAKNAKTPAADTADTQTPLFEAEAEPESAPEPKTED